MFGSSPCFKNTFEQTLRWISSSVLNRNWNKQIKRESNYFRQYLRTIIVLVFFTDPRTPSGATIKILQRDFCGDLRARVLV